MSRMLVYYVFPVFMTSALIIKSLVLINRGNIGDKERFNARLDRIRAGTHAKGIVIYPEGTRNLKPGYLPLRKGMLVYAYSRKLPVQIMITANKESVMGSEKRADAHFGQHIWVGYAPVMKPEDYATFDAFWDAVRAPYTHIIVIHSHAIYHTTITWRCGLPQVHTHITPNVQFQKSWDDEWKKVYGADPESLKVLQPQAPLFDYPLSMRAGQLLSVISGCVLFGLTMGMSVRGAVALSRKLGPTVSTILGGLLLTLAALLLEQKFGGGKRRAKDLARRQAKAVVGALPPKNAAAAAAGVAGAQINNKKEEGKSTAVDGGAVTTKRRGVRE